ncbi:hypothetical protein CMK11_00575 [Candidatus Poribacteria bacterium]|nr:hypothetical protein [Candidatus Poribacteria bacterium]
MYSSSEIHEIAQLFGFALQDFREITTGSTWMGRRYAVETDAGKLFLKVRSEWWSNAQAEYVCGLLEHLESHEFPVPSLRRAVDGRPFAVWGGHICECHEFVVGEPYAIGDLDHIASAAQRLAEFHSLTLRCPRPDANLGQDVGYPTEERIRFFAKRIRGFFLAHPEAIHAVDQCVDALISMDPCHSLPLPRSCAVVHGDYHAGNLIFDAGGVVAVCDLDLVQAAPRSFDLAYFLYRAAGKSVRSGGGIAKLDRQVCEVFLAAYHRHLPDSVPSTPEEETAFELLRFARYNALLTANSTRDPDRFLLWVADTNALAQQLSPLAVSR